MAINLPLETMSIEEKSQRLFNAKTAYKDLLLDQYRYEELKAEGEIFNDLYKDDIFLKEYIKDPDTFRWAFITDRIKLLLLRDFGGVYVDVDAKYVKPFDLVLEKLEDKHTFFAGMKTYDVQSSLVECAIYGATPNSRIINLCFININRRMYTGFFIKK